MDRMLLMSVIFSAVVFPVSAAKDPHPVRGLKRAVLMVFLYNIAYVLLLRYVYPRIVS